MGKLILQRSITRLKAWVASRRRHRWRLGGLLCLLFLVPADAVGRPGGLPVSGFERPIEIDIPGIVSSEPGPQPGRHDPVYDYFLQRLRPLRANVARRRYLATEVVTAATQHRIDPDLLFALVAVESNFNSGAVSSKGARGLGQVMFATARAVAPTMVLRPDDLHDVRRNLSVTALHLRQLLVEYDGDLRAALTAYRDGPAGVLAPPREEDRYVSRISTYFASLKARRDYRELVVMAAGDNSPSEN